MVKYQKVDIDITKSSYQVVLYVQFSVRWISQVVANLYSFVHLATIRNHTITQLPMVYTNKNNFETVRRDPTQVTGLSALCYSLTRFLSEIFFMEYHYRRKEQRLWMSFLEWRWWESFVCQQWLLKRDFHPKLDIDVVPVSSINNSRQMFHYQADCSQRPVEALYIGKIVLLLLSR